MKKAKSTDVFATKGEMKTIIKDSLKGYATTKQLQAVKDELRQEISGAKGELRLEISSVKSELRQKISSTKDELLEAMTVNTNKLMTAILKQNVAIEARFVRLEEKVF